MLNAPACPPWRDQLRQATAAAHAALEATALMRAVTEGVPGEAAYVAYLRGHWCVHAALEPLLAERLPSAWTSGRLAKTAWLEADLRALGAMVPAEPARPGILENHNQALGALYVLEGATLGLGVVGRRLAATHPARQGAGRFMAAYGNESAARWSAFMQLLAAQEPAGLPAACAAAEATFGLFQRAFEPWRPADAA